MSPLQQMSHMHVACEVHVVPLMRSAGELIYVTLIFLGSAECAHPLACKVQHHITNGSAAFVITHLMLVD
jgi:hypothetical protein